jgi:integrase
LSREAYAWIERWVQASGRILTTSCIFTAVNSPFKPESDPLSKHALWHIVKRAARKAGLDDVKPHDFRRYVATRVAERHRLRAAQRVLGHAVMMTTEKYYILDDELPGGITEDLF